LDWVKNNPQRYFMSPAKIYFCLTPTFKTVQFVSPSNFSIHRYASQTEVDYRYFFIADITFDVGFNH